MPILESHLVTQAYAWGGMLTRQGYNISPKALGVGAEIVTNGQGERTLEGKKPMGILLDKNNPQVDNTNSGNYGFGRFEDRTKTPSSPWSDFMGAATTSLLLRVLERPELQVARNKLRLLALEDPVRDFKRVSWGTNLACTHLTKSGAILTTAELQDEYAMITGEALQNIDLSQAEQYAFGEWLSINGELKKAKDKPDEILGLADRIGWAQKYYYLVRKFGYAALGSPSEKMYAECLHWDRVFPVGRAQKLALDRDPLGITAEDLEWYVNNPPQTTRARRRGAYIKAYGDELSDTAWSHFDLYGQTHRLHPYDNRLPNQ